MLGTIKATVDGDTELPEVVRETRKILKLGKPVEATCGRVTVISRPHDSDYDIERDWNAALSLARFLRAGTVR